MTFGPLQQQAVARQLNDNAVARGPDIQTPMPEPALATNVSMSAAFALGHPKLTGRSETPLGLTMGHPVANGVVAIGR